MIARAFTARGLLAAVMVFFLSGAAAANANWQITRFVVYEGLPSEALNWREEEAGNDDPVMAPALVQDVESYLQEVAKHLDKLGFVDPVATGYLDSIVRDGEGQEAIRIYLHKSSKESLAWYDPPFPCNAKKARRIIHVNARTFGIGNKITDTNYVSLAHELFHAIQSSSNLYRQGSCNHNKWLNEGMADAIGHYMARTFKNAKFPEDMKSVQFLNVFGGRNYALPLNDVPDVTEETYGTSSFFRHLAEVAYANGQSKTHPGSRPALEDYTYLVEFLATEYSQTLGIRGQIIWLNQTMKANPRIKNSLSDIYPRFVSALADHMNTRIPRLEFVADADRQSKWLKRIFGGDCDSVEIPGQNIQVQHTVKLDANASRCFTVKQPGIRSAGLTIELMDKDASLLKQLTIGMLDGTIVLKPDVRPHAAISGLNIASWKFPIFGPYSKTYVISNVAKNPEETKKYAPNLTFGLGTWDSTMTAALTAPPPAPPPPPPSPPPPSAYDWQGPQQNIKPTHREEQVKQMKEAVKDPVVNVKPVPKVERKRYKKPPTCDPVRLSYNLCGPQLVITLQLSPFGAFGDLMSIDQGAFGDFAAGMFTPSALQSPEASLRNSTMVELENTLQGMDASKIRITLPKLDYGFTGSISNADIWVSKANGGNNNYVSYGPVEFPGGRRLNRPPNGQVVIEEYSPLVLRGSFSAQLVDEANPGTSEAPIVATSISGTFMITSAWMADEDFIPDEVYIKQVMIENMLRNTPFGTDVVKGIIGAMDAPPQALCDGGVDDEQLQAMGFTSGCGGTAGGSITFTCSCECEKKDEELSECKRECYQPWQQCKVSDSDIPDDIEGQVELCKAALLKRGLKDDQQAYALQMFRMSPDFQRKEMLKSRWCGG